MPLPTASIEAGGRSPPNQGKAIGDPFPIEWNSKKRIVGQLEEEAGPCPDLVFLILEVRRTSWPHMQKDSLEVKEGDVKGCSTPFQ